MKVARAIAWLLVLAGLLVFSYFNWKPVEVTLWTNLTIKPMLPALVICAFLLGFLPMWLVHRARKWQLRRRIKSLENARTESDKSASSTTSSSISAPKTSSKKPSISSIGDRTPKDKAGTSAL